MAQIRNKLDIKNSILENEEINKNLPNFFDSTDEIKPLKGLSISVGVHVVLVFLFILLIDVQKAIFPHIPKPDIKQDIEFKLVQNESQTPINKKTKIRSDRNSRAGGKNDPKRAISQPNPKPAPSVKKNAGTPNKQKTVVLNKQVTQQPKKVVQQPKQNFIKQLTQQKPQAPAPKIAKSQPKTVQKPVSQKPTPMKAPGAVVPNARPSAKPNVAPISAPKIANAPNSPFKVAVPPSKAPVGSTYRPQTSGTGASSYSGGSSSSGSGLSPKFSTQKGSYGSGSGASGSKLASSPSYGSRGSYSGGSSGNPSPGNPHGAPGIDAIRQPNWGPYMRSLEQRIKRNWSPPKGDTSKRVVITFTIGRDGRLLSHRITKSSGVPLADRAAMLAIETSAPFSPLPPEFKGQSVPIEFTFDYNVLNSVLR